MPQQGSTNNIQYLLSSWTLENIQKFKVVVESSKFSATNINWQQVSLLMNEKHSAFECQEIWKYLQSKNFNLNNIRNNISKVNSTRSLSPSNPWTSDEIKSLKVTVNQCKSTTSGDINWYQVLKCMNTTRPFPELFRKWNELQSSSSEENTNNHNHNSTHLPNTTGVESATTTTTTTVTKSGKWSLEEVNLIISIPISLSFLIFYSI